MWFNLSFTLGHTSNDLPGMTSVISFIEFSWFSIITQKGCRSNHESCILAYTGVLTTTYHELWILEHTMIVISTFPLHWEYTLNNFTRNTFNDLIHGLHSDNYSIIQNQTRITYTHKNSITVNYGNSWFSDLCGSWKIQFISQEFQSVLLTLHLEQSPLLTESITWKGCVSINFIMHVQMWCTQYQFLYTIFAGI